MTEEEFKTRFDLTCFAGLLSLVVLGALLIKGCNYCVNRCASSKVDDKKVAKSAVISKIPMLQQTR